MKRSLAVIISAAFKSCNILFYKIRNSIWVSVWLRNVMEFCEFSKAFMAFFFIYALIFAYTLPLFVDKLKEWIRTLPNSQFHIFYHRRFSTKVNIFKTEALNA